MKTYEECRTHEVYSKIKQSTIESINNYVEHRLEPGGFVTAVLMNDLKGAMGRADIENRHSLFEIVSYVYNEIPSSCQGSSEKVREWLKMRQES